MHVPPSVSAFPRVVKVLRHVCVTEIAYMSSLQSVSSDPELKLIRQFSIISFSSALVPFRYMCHNVPCNPCLITNQNPCLSLSLYLSDTLTLSVSL